MKVKIKRILEDLIEQAQKLKRFEFDKHVDKTGLGFQARRLEDDDWEIDFGLPDEKERDAFLLTFRLFLQQNEAYSFHRQKQLVKDLELSENFRKQMGRINQTYDDYLAGYPETIKPDFFEKNEHPTRGDILKVVLYGAIAYTNDFNRRQKYKIWTHSYIRKSVLLQEFTRISLTVLRLIEHVAGLAEQELAK